MVASITTLLSTTIRAFRISSNKMKSTVGLYRSRDTHAWYADARASVLPILPVQKKKTYNAEWFHKLPCKNLIHDEPSPSRRYIGTTPMYRILADHRHDIFKWFFNKKIFQINDFEFQCNLKWKCNYILITSIRCTVDIVYQ